jgi:hypothetical protein
MQDLISSLAREQFSRMMREHGGRLTNQEYEDQSSINEPEIIKSWSDQQINDFHSKLDPTDKPSSSSSEDKQNLSFLEESNMRMLVYKVQKESLLDIYYAPGEGTNRDQEIERMIQLHDQNKEELVKILLEERNNKNGYILGRMPEAEIRLKLEYIIEKKIQEYINEKR